MRDKDNAETQSALRFFGEMTPTPRSQCVNAVDKELSAGIGVNAVDKGVMGKWRVTSAEWRVKALLGEEFGFD